MRWVPLCGSFDILWHYLSLVLELFAVQRGFNWFSSFIIKGIGICAVTESMFLWEEWSLRASCSALLLISLHRHYLLCLSLFSSRTFGGYVSQFVRSVNILVYLECIWSLSLTEHIKQIDTIYKAKKIRAFWIIHGMNPW